MTAAQAILHGFAACGGILTANGDRLDIDAPDYVLTEDLLTALRKHKTELLNILGAIAKHECPNGCGRMELQDHARDAWFCAWCRSWIVAGQYLPNGEARGTNHHV